MVGGQIYYVKNGDQQQSIAVGPEAEMAATFKPEDGHVCGQALDKDGKARFDERGQPLYECKGPAQEFESTFKATNHSCSPIVKDGKPTGVQVCRSAQRFADVPVYNQVTSDGTTITMPLHEGKAEMKDALAVLSGIQTLQGASREEMFYKVTAIAGANDGNVKVSDILLEHEKFLGEVRKHQEAPAAAEKEKDAAAAAAKAEARHGRQGGQGHAGNAQQRQRAAAAKPRVLTANEF